MPVSWQTERPATAPAAPASSTTVVVPVPAAPRPPAAAPAPATPEPAEEPLQLAQPWEMAQWQPATDAAPKEGESTEALELSEDRWQLLPAASAESADEAPIPMAAAWEFIQWQQPAAEPTPPPEEQVPLAQPWEMAQWQPAAEETPALEQPLPDASIAPLAEPLPVDAMQASEPQPAEAEQAAAPQEYEPLVPEPIAPEPTEHERLVPEPIDDGSNTSPYGLRTVSTEQARTELESETPAVPPAPKPDEPE